MKQKHIDVDVPATPKWEANKNVRMKNQSIDFTLIPLIRMKKTNVNILNTYNQNSAA